MSKVAMAICLMFSDMMCAAKAQPPEGQAYETEEDVALMDEGAPMDDGEQGMDPHMDEGAPMDEGEQGMDALMDGGALMDEAEQGMDALMDEAEQKPKDGSEEEMDDHEEAAEEAEGEHDGGNETDEGMYALMDQGAMEEGGKGDEEIADAQHEDPLTHEQLRGLHELADTNRDGKVSLEEAISFAEKGEHARADQMVQENLETILTKAPGTLAWHEYETHLSETQDVDASFIEHEKKKFDAADSSGDGLLAGDELKHFFHAFLSSDALRLESNYSITMQDWDGDGKLSLEEFHGEDDESKPDEEREIFRKHDTNGDGFIDVDEFGAFNNVLPSDKARQLFEVADANKDGNVSLEELLACCGSGTQDMDRDAMIYLREWVTL